MPLAFKRTKDLLNTEHKPIPMSIKKVQKDSRPVVTSEHPMLSAQKSSERLVNVIWKLPLHDLLPAHFHLLARALDIRALVFDGYFFPRTAEDIIRYIANPSLEPALKNLLQRLSYNDLRPVQLACFEPILHRKPCICISKTASGKTFAYLLPILLREGFLRATQGAPSQTLIICPTRVLCEQVSTVVHACIAALVDSCPYFRTFTVCSVYSGQSQSHINTSLALANMLIATPGILASRQHLFTGSTVVLDEYDDLLDGSFLEDIKQILRITSKPQSTPINAFTTLTKGVRVMNTSFIESSITQFICVSATMADEALAQAESFSLALSGSLPTLIAHGSINKIPSNIHHIYLISKQMDVDMSTREIPISKFSDGSLSGKITSIWHLKQLVEDKVIKSEAKLIEAVSSGTFYSKCIVFFLLRSRIDEDARRGQQRKRIFRLHGEMPQEIREEIIKQFSEASPYSGAVLFTTDLGARGLDSKDVDLVINIGLPSTALSFIHRVGRAGRMGQKSLAVSVISKHTDFLKQIDSCFEASTFK